MKTFNDDSICIQFIQAIELTNSQWKEHKKNGQELMSLQRQFITHIETYKTYHIILLLRILIGSCNEISNTFIANEALKNITTYVIME